MGKEYKATPMPKVAHVFKLYDLDLIEEENLIEWGKKGPSKKYVPKDVSKEIHEKAKPFINWLQEADEESSEEEEEDVEVGMSGTCVIVTPVVGPWDHCVFG